jgi:hypothetical protein
MEATMLELMSQAPSPITPGTYFGWGDVMIQSGNLVVIIAMLVLFVLALLLPFPGGRSRK